MSERIISSVALKAKERVRQLTEETWGRLRGEVLPPIEVEIQPTANCHRTCAFCSHIIRNRRGGELTSEDVFSLLAELERMQVKSIAFSGGGEPLYWKAGRLVEAIRTASAFARVILTSSGDQLWNDTRDELDDDALSILGHCSALQLNIPAVDDAGFQRQVHGPSSWKRTSSIISSLVELKSSRPDLRCKIYAVVVVSAFNVNQIAGIDEALMTRGFDGIYYKQLKNFEDRPLAKVRISEDTIFNTLDIIPAATRSADLDKFIKLIATNYETMTHCWVNRIGFDAIVDPDGDIYLCTPTVGKNEFCIGNLDNGGFANCWHGATRELVLRRLSDYSLHGVCPRECRNHGDNQLIDHGIRQQKIKVSGLK